MEGGNLMCTCSQTHRSIRPLKVLADVLNIFSMRWPGVTWCCSASWIILPLHPLREFPTILSPLWPGIPVRWLMEWVLASKRCRPQGFWEATMLQNQSPLWCLEALFSCGLWDTKTTVSWCHSIVPGAFCLRLTFWLPVSASVLQLRMTKLFWSGIVPCWLWLWRSCSTLSGPIGLDHQSRPTSCFLIIGLLGLAGLRC